MSSFKTPYDPMAAFYSALNGTTPGAASFGSGYGNLDFGVPAEPQYTLPTIPKPAGFTDLGSGYTGIPLPDTTKAVADARPDLLSWDGFFGKKLGDGTALPGWGSTALGIGQGLMNGYLGMQQYGLMKDQLTESKRQYDQNYAAQRTTTNTRLEDRQRARLASNPGAYESLGTYMDKNGVK